MHIRSEDEKKKRRPDMEKKIVLNIPVEGKKEIRQSEIHEGNSLLGISEKIDILQQNLEEFHLSCNGDLEYEDSSSSDSEADDLQKNVVSKGPIKDVSAASRLRSQPYFIQPQNDTIRIGKLQSGGNLIGTKHDTYTTESIPYFIPQTVTNFGSPETELTVSDIYTNLSENEKELLNAVLDMEMDSERSKSTTVNQKTRPKDSNFCNSPDSNYGTLSPDSIPPQSPSINSDSYSSEPELSPRPIPWDMKARPSCILIPGPPRPNTVLPRSKQLSPPRPKSIQPDSETIVKEYGLLEPAINRLKKTNIVKDKCVDIQWAAAVDEAKPLLQLLSKEELRKISDYEREDIRRKKVELRKKLIDLINEKPQRQYFFERLYSRIKLYQRNCFDVLTGKDANGHTPLYVAAVERNDCPLIARLIIDAIENIDAKLDEEENTILHYLVQLGDSHAQVLSELLYSNTNANKAKINKANIMSDTALHKAVKSHSNKSCLATVKQLIKHGASLERQDFRRQTALHLAIMHSGDPLLLKALLQSPTASRAIDLLDENSNTALHIAASRNDLPPKTQKELISLLVLSGAIHSIRNKQEKFAVTLVDEKRRQEIKNIIHRK